METVPLTAINLGDYIKCLSPTGNLTTCRIHHILHLEPPSSPKLTEFVQLCLTTDCMKSLKLSGNHFACLLPSCSGGISDCVWAAAKELRAGQCLLSEQSEATRIHSVKSILSPGFISFMTDFHTPVVDGVVVSDFAYFPGLCSPRECHNFLSFLAHPFLVEAQSQALTPIPLANSSAVYLNEAGIRVVEFVTDIALDGCTLNTSSIVNELLPAAQSGIARTSKSEFVLQAVSNAATCVQ